MSLVSLGNHVEVPTAMYYVVGSTNKLIDASGEKVAEVLYMPMSGTIAKVGFRTGTVTTSQALKISVQGVNSSGDPDGTILASGNAYGTVSSPSSSTWYLVTLNSSVSVSAGQAISIVVEFESTAGNLNILAINPAVPNQVRYCDHYTTSWSKDNLYCMISAIEFSDGTYCKPYPNNLMQATSTFNSGSSPNEYGNYFKLPFPCRSVGGYARMTISGAAGARLYDASDNILASATLNAGHRSTTSSAFAHFYWDSPVDLSKDTYYRIAIRATTTTDIGIIRNYTDSSSLFNCLPLGTDMIQTSRTGSGSWTNTNTNRMAMGLLVNAFDDASGGGGGSASGISRARVQGGM